MVDPVKTWGGMLFMPLGLGLWVFRVFQHLGVPVCLMFRASRVKHFECGVHARGTMRGETPGSHGLGLRVLSSVL